MDNRISCPEPKCRHIYQARDRFPVRASRHPSRPCNNLIDRRPCKHLRYSSRVTIDNCCTLPRCYRLPLGSASARCPHNLRSATLKHRQVISRTVTAPERTATSCHIHLNLLTSPHTPSNPADSG